MPKTLQPDPKLKTLRQTGTLNARSEDVKDPLFQENEFFDPRDLLQVKYEMLRRVKVDNASVTDVSSGFAFSRVAFYQAQKRFDMDGLAGLLPQRRGPKQAHKLTPEVVDYIEKAIAEDAHLRVQDLVERVNQHFGVSVHSRSIERALERRQKKS